MPSIDDTPYSKSKVSPDFMRQLLDPDTHNRDAKIALIQKLHAEKIDFRSLNQLRNQLLQSKAIQADNSIAPKDFSKVLDTTLRIISPQTQAELLTLISNDSG